MLKEYTIKKFDGVINEEIWENLPSVSLDCYPWDKNGYRPRVKAVVCWSEEVLKIRFIVWENNITVKYLKHNDPVYEDSCVEFFINPLPECGNGYFNFEINAVGTLLLGLGGRGREWSLLEDVDFDIFHIRSSIGRDGSEAFTGPFWCIEFGIPFYFMEQYFGAMDIKSGMKMRANFYKCGDQTPFPHFGAWNEIINPIPDFHKPEFFGNLVLGEQY